MGGKCIILSAPSGSGKTTLVKHLLACIPSLSFSVSATSRAPRDYEVSGKDYLFLSPHEFREKIAAKDFLEWEEVYTDQFYGTLQSEVDRIWRSGKSVVFDVDVVGGVNLKKALGEKALAVFIKAPSLKALEDRLRSRDSEDEASLTKRLAKAKEEMAFEQQFDCSVVNDDLETAKNELTKVVQQFLEP